MGRQSVEQKSREIKSGDSSSSDTAHMTVGVNDFLASPDLTHRAQDKRTHF